MPSYISNYHDGRICGRAVLFGANMSFATPFGYQTNLLILSTGGYRFADFLKAGIPLILILWIGCSIALPLLYRL